MIIFFQALGTFTIAKNYSLQHYVDIYTREYVLGNYKSS